MFKTGRGGQYTYHGPGQRVAYVMLDLKKRGPDVRCFVHNLEEWIIRSIAAFDIKGERRSGRVGIWVAPHLAAQVAGYRGFREVHAALPLKPECRTIAFAVSCRRARGVIAGEVMTD